MQGNEGDGAVEARGTQTLKAGSTSLFRTVFILSLSSSDLCFCDRKPNIFELYPVAVASPCRYLSPCDKDDFFLLFWRGT